MKRQNSSTRSVTGELRERVKEVLDRLLARIPKIAICQGVSAGEIARALHVAEPLVFSCLYELTMMDYYEWFMLPQGGRTREWVFRRCSDVESMLKFKSVGKNIKTSCRSKAYAKHDYA